MKPEIVIDMTMSDFVDSPASKKSFANFAAWMPKAEPNKMPPAMRKRTVPEVIRFENWFLKRFLKNERVFSVIPSNLSENF